MRALARTGAALVILALGAPQPVGAAPSDNAASAKAIDFCLNALFPKKSAEAAPEGSVAFVNASDNGRKLVALAMVGLAIQAHPERARWDASLARVDRALRWFIHNGTGLQDVWGLGLIGIYLAERHARGVKIARDARELVYRVEEGQNREGGWAHGSGLASTIDFYPSTLISSSNGCLAALGLLRRAGIAVDDDIVDATLALFRDVQGPRGAFPYGGRSYRKGYEAGRTAGALFALAACGKHTTPMFERAAKYTRANIERIPHGHASAALHVLYGGLGCAVLGDEVYAAYRQGVLAPQLAAQRSDGSLPAAVQSPDDLPLMGSEAVRAAYSTAAAVTALHAPRLQVVAQLRPAIKAPAATPRPGVKLLRLAAAWRSPQRATALVSVRDQLVCGAQRGRAFALSSAKGTLLWESEIPAARDIQGRAVGAVALPGGDVLMGFQPRREGVDAFTLRIQNGILARREPTPLLLARLRAKDGSVVWTRRLDGDILDIAVGATSVCVMRRGAPTQVLSLEDGASRATNDLLSATINGAVTAVPQVGYVLASEARLMCIDESGRQRWAARTPKQRDLTPPAIGALLSGEGVVQTVATDGVVRFHAGADGKQVATVDLGTAPAAAGTADRLVIVLGHDGVLRAVDAANHAIAWTAMLPRPGESLAPPQLATAKEHVWLLQPASREAYLVRASDGQVLGAVAARAGDPIAFGAHGPCIAAADGVTCYATPK